MLSQLKNLQSQNTLGDIPVEVDGEHSNFTQHDVPVTDCTVTDDIETVTNEISGMTVDEPLGKGQDSSAENTRKPFDNLKLHPATLCCFTRTKVKDCYNASSMPIYQSATFRQRSATEMGEYDYTRSGNPSRTFVEEHLAKLMNADRALCLSSGMTALDCILRLAGAGDEIIAGDDIYGGTNRLLGLVNKLYKINVHHVDTTEVEEVASVCNSKTKLVLLETPTNPLIKIVNIPAICQMVRIRSPDALIVVDNTMMSPYLQKPLDLGADIVYHSGTK